MTAPAWKLVPKEPTEEMIAAARRAIAADSHALYRGEPDSVRLFYRTMLAACPPVKSEQARLAGLR